MPARKRCARCHRLVPKGVTYCPTHQREYQARRGTTTQRGYGHAHQQQRAAITADIEAGKTIRCIDCGTALTPDTLDLGHTPDRSSYLGPQCASCNRSEGGKRGAAISNANRY